MPPSLSSEIHRAGLAVDLVDSQFVALLDAEALVGAVECDHIAGGVVLGHGLFGVGVAPGNQPFGLKRRALDLSVANQPLADDLVDLHAQRVARGHESGVLAFLRREFQPPRGGGAGEIVRLDFGDVGTEFLERFLDIPAQARLDRGFELGLALAHDLVHRRRFHARLLQLYKGFAGIDGIELLAVADEHHAGQAQFPGDAKEVSGLYGGGERAFVHHQHGLFERGAHLPRPLAGEAAFGHAGVAGQEIAAGFRFRCRIPPPGSARPMRTGPIP